LKQRDSGATVYLDNPSSMEDLEFALRRLKKICNDENIFTDLKKKEFYKKPSALRREKKLAAMRKNYKQNKEVFHEEEKN